MLPEIPPFLVKHYLELYNHIVSLGKRFLIRCNTWKWWGDTADEAGRVLPSPGIAVMSRAALLKVLGEVHSISWKKGFLAKFIWETLVFKSSWWSLFSAGLVRNFKCTVWISLLYSISQTYLTNKPFSPPTEWKGYCSMDQIWEINSECWEVTELVLSLSTRKMLEVSCCLF